MILVGFDRRLGGINCMGTCDITKDGRTDMLVGRDDGTLEIWSMDMGVEPSLIFSKCINESISGVSPFGFLCVLTRNPTIIPPNFPGLLCFGRSNVENP